MSDFYNDNDRFEFGPPVPDSPLREEVGRLEAEIRRLQEELNKFAGLARAQSFQLASLRKDNERLRADWAEVGKGAERQLLSALEVVRYIKQLQEENERLREWIKKWRDCLRWDTSYESMVEDMDSALEGK